MLNVAELGHTAAHAGTQRPCRIRRPRGRYPVARAGVLQLRMWDTAAVGSSEASAASLGRTRGKQHVAEATQRDETEAQIRPVRDAGLRWADVNLTAGCLVVRQQIVQLDGAESACGGVPRRAQKSPVWAAQDRVRRSTPHRPQRVRHWGAAGSPPEPADGQGGLGAAYRDHNLVAAKPNGDPMKPERLTKRFSELVRGSRSAPYPPSRPASWPSFDAAASAPISRSSPG